MMSLATHYAVIEELNTHLAKEDILPRFLYGMMNEAARCLEEKIIARADFLDLSLIMGIGFPPPSRRASTPSR